jgi:amidase
MTRDTTSPETWSTLVAQKRKQLDAQIPSEWRLSEKFLASIPSNGRLIEAGVVRCTGILSDDELDITENYSAAALLSKLAQGELSSLAVTTAFCKRAAIAQQLV